LGLVWGLSVAFILLLRLLSLLRRLLLMLRRILLLLLGLRLGRLLLARLGFIPLLTLLTIGALLGLLARLTVLCLLLGRGLFLLLLILLLCRLLCRLLLALRGFLLLLLGLALKLVKGRLALLLLSLLRLAGKHVATVDHAPCFLRETDGILFGQVAVNPHKSRHRAIEPRLQPFALGHHRQTITGRPVVIVGNRHANAPRTKKRAPWISPERTRRESVY